MDTDTKHRLARTGDLGLEACAIRLRAARYASGISTQMELASEYSGLDSTRGAAWAGGFLLAASTLPDAVALII